MQRVFLGPMMATKRVARAPHRCWVCGRTIETREEYYPTSVRIGDTIEHRPICEECWHGPKLQLQSKRYKYRPKESAKSDGVTAELRLNKEKPKVYEF